MDKTRLGIAVTVAAALAGFSGVSLADGKAKFDAACGECHFADDFEGEDTAEIQGIISGIVAGDVEHKKKLTLSEAEIAEIAKYMTTGS